MRLPELINKKTNLGTVLDILFCYGYSKETTLGKIDKEYIELETVCHNILCDLEPTQNKEHILVDVEKNFTVSFLE